MSLARELLNPVNVWPKTDVVDYSDTEPILDSRSWFCKAISICWVSWCPSKPIWLFQWMLFCFQASSSDSDAPAPAISVEDARKILGLGENASFEQAVKAKNRLLTEAKQDSERQTKVFIHYVIKRKEAICGRDKCIYLLCRCSVLLSPCNSLSLSSYSHHCTN